MSCWNPERPGRELCFREGGLGPDALDSGPPGGGHAASDLPAHPRCTCCPSCPGSRMPGRARADGGGEVAFSGPGMLRQVLSTWACPVTTHGVAQWASHAGCAVTFIGPAGSCWAVGAAAPRPWRDQSFPGFRHRTRGRERAESPELTGRGHRPPGPAPPWLREPRAEKGDSSSCL